jgi:hypothetical protein
MTARPNFFIVGAAKAGTTSLASYLGQHPDVFLPGVKEPKFLSAPENVFPHLGPGDDVADARVVHGMEEYLALFAPGGGARARGEASVDSLVFPGVPGRLRGLFPDARIIAILRNPVDRAHSAWMHLVRDGRENLPFAEALAQERRRREANWEFLWWYERCGRYAEPLARFLETFGRERCKVVLFDQLKADPEGLCREIFAFLGVDAGFTPDASRRLNVSGAPKNRRLHDMFHTRNPLKALVRPLLPRALRERIRSRVDAANMDRPRLDPETRAALARRFDPELAALEQLLDIDLGHWRNAT